MSSLKSTSASHAASQKSVSGPAKSDVAQASPQAAAPVPAVVQDSSKSTTCPMETHTSSVASSVASSISTHAASVAQPSTQPATASVAQDQFQSKPSHGESHTSSVASSIQRNSMDSTPSQETAVIAEVTIADLRSGKCNIDSGSTLFITRVVQKDGVYLGSDGSSFVVLRHTRKGELPAAVAVSVSSGLRIISHFTTHLCVLSTDSTTKMRVVKDTIRTPQVNLPFMLLSELVQKPSGSAHVHATSVTSPDGTITVTFVDALGNSLIIPVHVAWPTGFYFVINLVVSPSTNKVFVAFDESRGSTYFPTSEEFEVPESTTRVDIKDGDTLTKFSSAVNSKFYCCLLNIFSVTNSTAKAGQLQFQSCSASIQGDLQTFTLVIFQPGCFLEETTYSVYLTNLRLSYFRNEPRLATSFSSEKRSAQVRTYSTVAPLLPPLLRPKRDREFGDDI